MSPRFLLGQMVQQNLVIVSTIYGRLPWPWFSLLTKPGHFAPHLSNCCRRFQGGLLEITLCYDWVALLQCSYLFLEWLVEAIVLDSSNYRELIHTVIRT